MRIPQRTFNNAIGRFALFRSGAINTDTTVTENTDRMATEKEEVKQKIEKIHEVRASI
jgi:predicted transcriptional regulator